MSSRPSPHPRPRPGPRPAPVSVADAPGAAAPGQARARARVASKLAAHPRASQRGAIGVLFVAIGALVVSGAGSSVAGVTAAPAPHRVPVARPAPVVAMPAGPALAAAAGVTTKSKVKRRPTHAGKPAPVGHGVISGLAANGIPQVALNAYRVAAARMANVEPGCGIPWYLLAGIGREESDHGRFGGAVLHADGVSTPPIIGPALDGKVWDFIPAPGNGLALDGDAKYAHALGPMQFIPSTWAGYGADADGDGRANIFDINDAALGAARYLCAAGGDLSTTAGRTRAVLTYNHNDQYLAQVLALAEAYRTGVPISGLPVGITKGALPKVTDTGYIPPANPGSPTAVDKTKHKPGHGGATKTTPKSGGTSSSAPAKNGSPGSGQGSGSSAPTATSPSHGAPTSGTSKPSPSPTTSSPAPSPTTTCDPLLGAVLGCKNASP